MLPIGKTWAVIAPGERPPRDRIPLVIKRGAFGSGEHETTFTCLEELEAMGNLKGKRVLDLGCGTGILAIAAALLGAKPVVAVDIDPRAVEVTRENARLNNANLEVYQGSLDKARGSFHLIMANVQGDILMDLARDMVSRLSPRGTLLLSGVAFHENYQVLLTFRQLGCRLKKNRFLEEYTTLVMEKTSSRF